MVKKVHDLPEDVTEQTLASKLRAGRDNTGLSRQKVQVETGISAKSIEKYEDGSAEPPISRLKTLCKLYNLSMDEFLNDRKTAEIHNLGNVPSTPKEMTGEIPEDDISLINFKLNKIDEFRKSLFKGSARRSDALASELLEDMKHLEANELLELAKSRGLFMKDCPSVKVLIDLFQSNFDEAQNVCDSIEDRIVDTAVLGVDVNAIELNSIKNLFDDLKEEFELETFGIFTSVDHSNLIPEIKPSLTDLALRGKGINFSNKKIFPVRKVASSSEEKNGNSVGLFA